MKRLGFLTLFTLLLLSATAQPKYEMRGAWIATVANIDWPKAPGLSVEEQQRQMIEILDTLQALNMNSVVFQIRPTSDAFYDSEHEPWSLFLNGEQGLAPDPYWDPLDFVINEAHKRFIEVHVWLNPYRVLNNENLALLHPDHLYYRKPELFVKYGGQYYFNPGLEETRAYLNIIVADVVTRYDIDAIHFDDYFYPYRVGGQVFPDQKTFKDYPRGYSKIDDWRRNNVDLIIAELSKTIKDIKPWVEFGISPFGVWRNQAKDPVRGSATRAGVTNYDDLYADILKWLDEGTIDYVVPQLYWEIGKTVADYRILAEWWSKYSFGRNLYIGLFTSYLGEAKGAAAWRHGNELIRQMKLNEQHPEISGTMHFSVKAIMENRQGIADSLRQSNYKLPALVPVNSNVKGGASDMPNNLRIEQWGSRQYLLWDDNVQEGGYTPAYYIVYLFTQEEPIDLNNPANIFMRSTDNVLDLENFGVDFTDKTYTFIVTSVNRFKYESAPAEATYKF